MIRRHSAPVRRNPPAEGRDDVCDCCCSPAPFLLHPPPAPPPRVQTSGIQVRNRAEWEIKALFTNRLTLSLINCQMRGRRRVLTHFDRFLATQRMSSNGVGLSMTCRRAASTPWRGLAAGRGVVFRRRRATRDPGQFLQELSAGHFFTETMRGRRSPVTGGSFVARLPMLS